MPMQRSYAGAPGRPSEVPQAWWEFWCSIWNPYEFILTPIQFNTTIVCPANTPNNSANLNITEPFYAFTPASHGVTTQTGAAPAFPYRIGFRSGTDFWTGSNANGGTNTIDSGIVTGDYNTGQLSVPRTWSWPRELAQNDIVTVQVDNNYNAASAAITVDVSLLGFGVRRRPETLHPGVPIRAGEQQIAVDGQ